MDNGILTYFLLFFLFVICLIPLFFAIKKRKIDTFEIIYWASAYFILIFIFRSFYLLIFGSLFLDPPPFSEETIIAWNISLLYLIASFVIFLVGYYSGVGRSIAKVFPKLPKEWSFQKTKIFLPVFIAIGISSLLILFYFVGGFSYYFAHKGELLTIRGISYLNFGIWFLNYALLIGLISVFKYRKLKKTTFLLLLPLSLAVGFLRGSKLVFLGPILMGIVAFHYFKKSIKMRYIFLFLLLAILIIPILDANRGSANLSDVINSFRVYSDPLKPITIFMNRFHDMDSMIYIVRDTPGVMDYQLGKTIAPVFVSWIPTQLWPEKPIIAFGRTFGENYYKKFWTSTSGAASATIIGEAYINFHIAGILWVSLLFGILLKFLYQYFIKNNFGATGVFIYASIFYQLFMAWESDFSTAVTGLIFSLFSVFLISFLLSKREMKTIRN